MKSVYMALAGLTALICGCNPIVADPLDADAEGNLNGNTSTSSGGGTSTESQGPASSAIAMKYSQFQQLMSPSATFAPQPFNEPGPDDLVLLFGTVAQSCDAPVIQLDPAPVDPAECAAQAFWQNILFIPQDLAHPGTIDLDQSAIWAYRATWMPDCGGGSANTPGVEGTLEIVSLDALDVTVNLTLAGNSSFPDANGEYIAPFCQ